MRINLTNKAEILLRHTTNHNLVNLLLLLFFLFNTFISNYLSFSNVYVDRFFHYSDEFLFYLLIFILLGKLFLFFKNKYIKNLIVGLLAFDFILFILTFLIFIVLIFESEMDNRKYYFADNNGYKYYALTPRRSALDDLNINAYKEKEIFLFIKERQYVNRDDIVNLGIDPNQLNNDFRKFYFKQKSQKDTVKSTN